VLSFWDSQANYFDVLGSRWWGARGGETLKSKGARFFLSSAKIEPNLWESVLGDAAGALNGTKKYGQKKRGKRGGGASQRRCGNVRRKRRRVNRKGEGHDPSPENSIRDT